MDVCEATDHPEKGAMVVTKIKVEASVLLRVILKQTPRHLGVIAPIG